MLPHYVEAYKATDEARGWAEEEEGRQWSRKREREGDSLELGKSVSHTVFLLPCSHANKHRHQTHQCVHTRIHTQRHTHIHTCMSPRPAVTTFWNPQNAVVKRGLRLTAFLSPLGGYRGQARLSWKEKQQQQRGSKFWQSDRHTWRIHTPDIYIVKWTHGRRISRPQILLIHLIVQSDSPESRHHECAGVCLWVWGTLAPVCRNFMCILLKKI